MFSEASASFLLQCSPISAVDHETYNGILPELRFVRSTLLTLDDVNYTSVSKARIPEDKLLISCNSAWVYTVAGMNY